MESNTAIDFAEYDFLLGKIYDAAIDISRWPAFMEHLVGTLNAKSSLLRVQNVHDKDVSAWFSHGMHTDFEPNYIEHFDIVDPAISFLATLPVGEIVQTAADMQESEFASSEYFDDYLSPLESGHLAGGFLFRSGAQVATFGVHKSEQMGAFTGNEMELLELLSPHMQRAIQVNRQLLQLETRSIATSAALDRMPISIVLVDMSGKPVYSNQQAKKLSLGKHGFSVESNRLASSSTQNLNAIHKLVHLAISSPAPQSGVHAIQFPGSTRPLTVLVTRIDSNHQFNLGTDYTNISAALFISNPDQAIDFPIEILNRLYGLTPAEHRLIVALVNGDELHQIADNLSLSKNTIRNQLRSCFRKTGTKRQSELVALILSSVPILACLESTIKST